MRLISSELALRAILALSANDGLTLSRLAVAVEASLSAAQRAVEILVADRVVERVSGSRPVYQLRSTETAGHVAALALGEVETAAALRIGARANASLEFLALRDGTLIVVFSGRSTAMQQARAARFVEGVAARGGLEVQYLDHDDVRRDVLVNPELRQRMAKTEIVFGNLDQTFPDRSRHWAIRGQPLHRPHGSLRLPSSRTVRALARRHGVDSLWLFGSAVRSDFRPDSDVDVVVRYLPQVRRSLRSMIDLEHALEAALGRDVDVVREENLRPEIKDTAEGEAVSLL
jgi:predicted nucleotidyltransferase